MIGRIVKVLGVSALLAAVSFVWMEDNGYNTGLWTAGRQDAQ